jgi:hypothetical protein
MNNILSTTCNTLVYHQWYAYYVQYPHVPPYHRLKTLYVDFPLLDAFTQSVLKYCRCIHLTTI